LNPIFEEVVLRGRAYEAALSPSARRRSGSFYTPPAYVRWLAAETLIPILDGCRSAEEVLALRIADPACGAGYFLVEAAWLLATDLASRTGTEAGDWLPAVQECLTGIDTDAGALRLLGGLLPAVRLLERDALAGEWGEGYDAVLGNPPFGRGVGPGNVACRFLRLCLDRLRPGGRLGLILPKSVAHVQAYAPVRAWIAGPTVIRDLGRGWGEVGLEQIALATGRPGPEASFPMLTAVGQDGGRTPVPVSLIGSLGLWPLYLDREAGRLVERLWQGSAPLVALCRQDGGRPLIFRGLPYQSRYDLLTRGDTDIPVLGGRHLTHYTIRPGPYRRLPPPLVPQRMRGPKVIAKRLVSSCPRIEAAWDRTGLASFDTVANIVPDRGTPAEYLTGLLNSRLAAWYLRDVLFNRSVLSVDLDLPYLGRFPVVPWKGSPSQREILDLVRQLSLDAAACPEEPVPCEGRADLIEAIDGLVLRLYGVTEAEALVTDRTGHLARQRRRSGSKR
jgi:SAM-dependent methyltransferase